MQPQTTPINTETQTARQPARRGATARVLTLAKGHSPVTASQDEQTRDPDYFPDLIVAIARDRDQSAFVRLFEHFAPRIKSLVMKLGASPARAEEVAQDTMLAVWRKAQLFDPAGASASGWIYRIAKNLHVDELRRDGRSERVAALGLDTDDVPQPDAILSMRDTEGRVRSAVAALNDEQLRVITMSFFEDKAHAEIAKDLGIPLGTVKSRVRLAMQRLRDLLDDQ